MALRLLARPVVSARPSLLASRFAVSSASKFSLPQQNVRLFSDKSLLSALTSNSMTSKGATSHWSVERLLSVALAPSFVLGVFVDSTVLDLIIVGALVPHCHLGMQQVLMDYVHPRKFPVAGPAANALLVGATVLATIGLLKLTFDNGLTRSVKTLLHQ